MTVEGTTFLIRKKEVTKKGNTFASHKYGWKSTLRYELDVDILMGNLAWIQGPYPACMYTNVTFQEGSAAFL